MSPEENPAVDIIIPVYREGEMILPVLRAIRDRVRTPVRVFICHDHDDDPTLEAIRSEKGRLPPVHFVRNQGVGALGAVMTGFRLSTAPVVAMVPADDDYNEGRLDAMFDRILQGTDIVCPSRFLGDGCMEGCPLVKAFLVRSAAWFLYHFAGVPTRDPTNGFRVFSRRVIDRIPIETRAGFGYSIEYLVKAQRLGWRIEEQPVQWFERKKGRSRFRILAWAPSYLRWVGYALLTRFLKCGPATVRLRGP